VKAVLILTMARTYPRTRFAVKLTRKRADAYLRASAARTRD
jgi:hypothetical protein